MARLICDHHHHHDLLLSADEIEPFHCYGCWEKGLGARYACVERCGHVLHKYCANPREILTHPFFPDCTFHFLEVSKPNRRCDACGGDVNGYVYHCFEQGWDLHPCCAYLKHRKLVETEEGDGSMLLTLHRRERSECFVCGKKRLNRNARSWTYVSECGKYHFHVACMKKEAIEAADEGRGQEIEKLANKLSVAGRSRSAKASKFAKIAKIVKIAIGFVMAAVVGDPSTLLISVMTTLFSNNG
ncbi:uncharacterized protein LOC121991380 [Zingiber officinale]|uniref:uncharacterized protein LOC121991380 n=1 Tax=Zingiber officinale TaxID=94328 RepID=UPI001C4A7B58|nr:uncharacterized protein LOC121991380 [Zingiber officinale]